MSSRPSVFSYFKKEFHFLITSLLWTSRHYSLLLWPCLLCYHCFRSMTLCCSQGLTFQLTPGCCGHLVGSPSHCNFESNHSCGLYVASKQPCSENSDIFYQSSSPSEIKEAEGVAIYSKEFWIRLLICFIFSTVSIAQTYLQSITNSNNCRGYWWSTECSGIIIEIRCSPYHRHLGSIAALLLLKWLCKWFLLII